MHGQQQPEDGGSSTGTYDPQPSPTATNSSDGVATLLTSGRLTYYYRKSFTVPSNLDVSHFSIVLNVLNGINEKLVTLNLLKNDFI